MEGALLDRDVAEVAGIFHRHRGGGGLVGAAARGGGLMGGAPAGIEVRASVSVRASGRKNNIGNRSERHEKHRHDTTHSTDDTQTLAPGGAVQSCVLVREVRRRRPSASGRRPTREHVSRSEFLSRYQIR